MPKQRCICNNSISYNSIPNNSIPNNSIPNNSIPNNSGGYCYYSSVNQGQTGACTSPPPAASDQEQGDNTKGGTDSSNGSGISAGGKAGIGVGVTAGVLSILGVILWLWKAGFLASWLGIAGSAGAGGDSVAPAASQPPPSWQGQAGSQGWGGHAGSQGWGGQAGGSGPPAPPPPSVGNQVPFVPVVGMARRSRDEQQKPRPNASVTDQRPQSWNSGEASPACSELPVSTSSNAPWIGDSGAGPQEQHTEKASRSPPKDAEFYVWQYH
ncbi:hypothetical protein DV736_g5425, partial [Chaetothyriales sp. CBS 134916]